MESNKESELIDRPRWDITDNDKAIIKFIRREAGRVYRDQLNNVFGKSQTTGDSVSSCIDHAKKMGWILEDDTKGIVTIPSSRDTIDSVVNNVMICPSTAKEIQFDKDFLWRVVKIEQYGWGKIELNRETMGIVVEVFPWITITGFNIDDIYLYFYNECKNEKEKRLLHFEGIVARSVRFKGNTVLSVRLREDQRTWFEGRIDFRWSVFEGELFVDDLVFKASNNSFLVGTKDNGQICFRGCVFNGGFSFRNLVLQNTSVDTIVSFEDAIVKERFAILHSDLGHANINCFQMVAGDFVFCPESREKLYINDIEYNNMVVEKPTVNPVTVCLKDLAMYDDAIIDLSSAEFFDGSQIKVEDIPLLPNIFLNFQKKVVGQDEKGNCPEISLSIENCSLYGIMRIGNVSKLSLKEFTNLGTIESAPEIEWGQMRCDCKFPGSSDKLVGAVQNQYLHNKAELKSKKSNEKQREKRRIVYETAQSFNILKKNYEVCGKNDSEDDALVHYMWHHHRINGQVCTKRIWFKEAGCWALYRVLYWTGKFGTSPLLIAISFMVSIIIFAVVFDIGFVIGNGGFDGLISSITSLWNLKDDAFTYSISCILPISAKFELGVELKKWATVCGNIEHILGSILIWYFSIALVRKTMR